MLEKIKRAFMDPEMDDDWYARYDAACVKQHAANTRLGAAQTELAEAKLQLERATQELQQIFRERIDLREGLTND